MTVWGLEYQLGNILTVLCQATVFLDLSVCVRDLLCTHRVETELITVRLHRIQSE